MELYKRMITSTVLLAGLAGLFGCGGNNSAPAAPQPKSFATVPVYSSSGLELVSGDFDGDGFSDVVVSSCVPDGFGAEGRLYFLKNENGRLSQPVHFATFPVYSKSTAGLVGSDFDNDGDLDILVGSCVPSGLGAEGRFFQFNNDGKGNFSQEGGN